MLAMLWLATTGASAQSLETPAWLHKAQAGNIVYFTRATPARVERYDMEQGKWLASITLSNTPTAFAVDAGGMTIAYDREVYTRALDGTGETALYNSANPIRALLHSPDFIVVASVDSWVSFITTIRRTDRQFIATWQGTYAFGAGYSIDPANRRIFGIDSFTSGYATNSLTFNADGTWPNNAFKDAGSYYHTSGQQPRSFVSPDGAILILGAGYVYDPVALTFRTSLAGVVDDLAFQGSDTPIVLRGNRLVAYSNASLESGSVTLTKTTDGINILGDQVFAFGPDPNGA